VKKFTKPFVMRTGELSNSPAFRALSHSAHRVLGRLEVEICNHGGKDNGKLPVTLQNFRDYGIERHAINPAIRELESLGFIEVTQRGSAGKAEQRRPNLFRLTYLPSYSQPPTNEWIDILSIKDAKRISKEARSKVASHRQGFRWQQSPSSRCGKTPSSDVGNPHQETAVFDAGPPPQGSKTPDAGNPHVYLDIYPDLGGQGGTELGEMPLTTTTERRAKTDELGKELT
jgi:hypothetical protein